MNLSEFLQGTFPHISGETKKNAYFPLILRMYLRDSALMACKVFDKGDSTMNKIFNGARGLDIEDAKFINSNKDFDKFTTWLDECIDEYDSSIGLSNWLDNYNIPFQPERISSVCFDLLTLAIQEFINKKSTKKTSNKLEVNIKLVNEIETKIDQLFKPQTIPVPLNVSTQEKTYISELYKAYGDAESISDFNESTLDSFDEYKDDFADRRIEYYSAESVRRSVQEISTENLSNQFEVLKNETYEGIKDTSRIKHSNGYEHMLAIMQQTISLPLSNYLFKNSPQWISPTIRKGVCHHLVNDHKLKWVKK